MILRRIGLILLLVSISSDISFASTIEKTLKGQFILREGKIYFSDNAAARLPEYEVQWKANQFTQELCFYNIKRECPLSTVSYEKIETAQGKRKIFGVRLAM